MGQINFSNRGGHGWGESARMEGKSNLNLSFPPTRDHPDLKSLFVPCCPPARRHFKTPRKARTWNATSLG